MCGGYIYIYIVNPPLIPSLKRDWESTKRTSFLKRLGPGDVKRPTANGNVFRNCSFSLELSTPPTSQKYGQIDVISLNLAISDHEQKV